MHDNKVSEKAIWEGSITPDNNTPSFASPMHTQPQMMFCYKCNQVIPGNSTYCPYCQVELFTVCPKCGAKYSSQYPACSQCGTNRLEYQQSQRRKQEAIERENRRQKIILEQKRKEEEEEKNRQRYNELIRKDAYNAENNRIVKTKEYESIFSLVSEGVKAYRKRTEWIISLTILFLVLFPLFPLWIIYVFYINTELTNMGVKAYLEHYAAKQNICYDKDMLDEVCRYNFDEDSSIQELSNICIAAYRKKNGLPNYYK